MTEMDDEYYRQKYMKYKAKYIDLKMHGGVSNDPILPFEQVDMKSADFIDVISNQAIISQIHGYLAEQPSIVLKSFISSYAPDVEVIERIYSDKAYNKMITLYDAHIKKSADEGSMENANAKRALKETFEARQRRGLSDLTKYKRTKGRIVQPLVVSPDLGMHATAIMVDYDESYNNKKGMMSYIDPHFHATSTGSYDNFLNIREKIIAEVPDLSEFWFGNMHEVVDFSYSCPVFQRSFTETVGMCPMWSTYLTLLFAINTKQKFINIIKAHERNAPWTQRNLQQFVYNVYLRFKTEIDQISPINAKYTVTGKTAVGNIKGIRECESHAWFWSTTKGKCYETEKQKLQDECADTFYDGKCWKDEELFQYIQKEIDVINNSSMTDDAKEYQKSMIRFSNIPSSIIDRLRF